MWQRNKILQKMAISFDAVTLQCVLSMSDPKKAFQLIDRSLNSLKSFNSLSSRSILNILKASSPQLSVERKSIKNHDFK
jgi:hypothetical protein